MGKILIIVLILFSILLVQVNFRLDLTLQLCSLIFAILVCFLLLIFGKIAWHKNSELKKTKCIFSTLDFVYPLCIFFTIVSLFFASRNTVFFHYAFVAIGMFCVFIFARTEEFNNLIGCFSKKKLLVNSIIFIVFINSLIGVSQFIFGKEIIGTFGYSSFFGCYLAINVPITFGFFWPLWESRKTGNQLSDIRCRFCGALSFMAFLIILGVVILTKSRSAFIGVGIVLPIMYLRFTNYNLRFLKSKVRLFSAICILVALALFCGKFLYKLKPMSAVGRTLIWRVSSKIFFKNPVSGVGFGNFANQYNLYQADFFAFEKGTVINKMTAGQIRHAYNWYLETAAEFGIFGLVVFGIFWWLVLKEVYKAFKPYKKYKDIEEKQTEYGILNTDYLTLGMAGSVLCFMIMCLFQFPNKIIPTYLIFNVALAWIVNTNQKNSHKSTENAKEKITSCPSYPSWLQKLFWVLALVVSIFFVAIYFQRYMAARKWHNAHDLAIAKKYPEAEIIYSNIYPKLKWNGKFLAYYGNIKLQNKKYLEAIELFEKAKFTYPNPYLFEKLGTAYLNYQIGIEEHPPKSPLKEGLCLSPGECVNKAINYWMLASNILPWRLTPKYYLADLYYQLGETNEAIKYARLVVNTPMKKWTEKGKEFKLKSQKMLIALGEKCDVPGLIVFDINNKSTWNEGLW